MGTLHLKMFGKGLILLCSLVLAQSAKLHLDNDWEGYKLKFSKSYETAEEETRREIWEDNLDFIEKHNAAYKEGKVTYSVKENEFSDMTNTEFASKFANLQVSPARGINKLFTPDPTHQVRSAADWRNNGYVTQVKNQGQCGSCWAFSTTGSLEGQHFKKTGQLVSLSEQQLVDCSKPYGTQGCQGGFMDNAFNYIRDNGGIASESSYPYTGREGWCHYDSSMRAATLQSWTDVSYGSESGLAAAVSQVGPVAVAIDASQRGFQQYHQGVYYDPYCSNSRLNHAVLAVGYGGQWGNGYWIVKNSWGYGWGNGGYINMAKDRGNHCGIANTASYPNV